MSLREAQADVKEELQNLYSTLGSTVHNLCNLFVTYGEVFEANQDELGDRYATYNDDAANIIQRLLKTFGMLDKFDLRYRELESLDEMRSIYFQLVKFALPDVIMRADALLMRFETELCAANLHKIVSCRAQQNCAQMVRALNDSIGILSESATLADCDLLQLRGNLRMVHRVLSALCSRVSVLALSNRPSHIEFRAMLGTAASMDFPSYNAYFEARQRATMRACITMPGKKEVRADLNNQYNHIFMDVFSHGKFAIDVGRFLLDTRIKTNTPARNANIPARKAVYGAIQESFQIYEKIALSRLHQPSIDSKDPIITLVGVLLKPLAAINEYIMAVMDVGASLPGLKVSRTDFSKLITELTDIRDVLSVTKLQVLLENASYILYAKLCKDEFVRITKVMLLNAKGMGLEVEDELMDIINLKESYGCCSEHHLGLRHQLSHHHEDDSDDEYLFDDI
ncbi:hypothetical protein BABINDRAFT_162583, partial [Babjeviella inositovora NRRL Y-12698]